MGWIWCINDNQGNCSKEAQKTVIDVKGLPVNFAYIDANPWMQLGKSSIVSNAQQLKSKSRSKGAAHSA